MLCTQNNGGDDKNYKSPYLEIVVQPQSKFRFRYKSEMTGKHGSLLGASSSDTATRFSTLSVSNCASSSGNNTTKTFPTVKVNFNNTLLKSITLYADLEVM